MTWVLVVAAMWVAVALVLGVIIGRSIRRADRDVTGTEAAEAAASNVVDLDPRSPRHGASPVGGESGSRP